jgi:hypothetical protein
MKTYARIDTTGVVAELLTTDANPATMFNPALRWQDVTGLNVQVGWVKDGAAFKVPPPSTAPSTIPSLADLLAQLATLSSHVAALQAKS